MTLPNGGFFFIYDGHRGYASRGCGFKSRRGHFLFCSLTFLVLSFYCSFRLIGRRVAKDTSNRGGIRWTREEREVYTQPWAIVCLWNCRLLFSLRYISTSLYGYPDRNISRCLRVCIPYGESKAVSFMGRNIFEYLSGVLGGPSWQDRMEGLDLERG